MHSNPFTDDELNRRLAATQEEMATRSLDLILLSAPEHVFYLTGLEHWGYFAPHVLIVPAAGDLVLVTRAMEHVVIRNQVRNATFIGHTDSETAADLVIRHLKGATSGKCIGLEAGSAGLSYAMGETLKREIDAGYWVDITGMLDEMRLVQCGEEQDYKRKAAVD